MDRTTLGDRMKNNYENITRYYLTRRMPVIIRLDGRNFHTFTRGFKKPFDDILVSTMQDTMKYLCENIQGCVLGYTQSDEISLVLNDYAEITTDAWFGNNLQKMCSVSASMATLAFNKFFSGRVQEFMSDCCDDLDGYIFPEKRNDYDYAAKVYFNKFNAAMFDSRVFTIPKEEVCNYLIWRQQDATRNSIQSVGQANFSQKELHGKSCNNIQDMLMLQKGINWNVGLDFAVLNNKLSGSINYFNRTQKDLLGDYNVSVPPYLFSTTFANVGTMKNSGVELELQADIVNNKDFGYSISLVGATMDNRFVSFSNSEYEGQKFYYVAPTEDPFPFHYLQRIEEGERVGNFYMWKFAGFNSSGEWVVYDKNGEYKLGMDATDEDMYYVGNGLPKFTASWSNYLRYKNFDLNVFFRGAFGFDIFNIHEFYYGIPKLTSNVMKIAFTKNAQIKENPLVCDYYLEKGDYLKLDLVSLGYTFKFKNKYVDSLRLSLTGKNLLTLTSFSGVDPSTYSTNGLTPGATGSRNYYPTTRQFLFGLQLGF